LAGNLNASEWAKKYYGLKRNYDAISRICKEKCARNDQLEGEVSRLAERSEKYDDLLLRSNESAERSKNLSATNCSLQQRVDELEKKLNLNEQTLGETKDTLRRKTRVHLDLEDTIQRLSLSLSETKGHHKEKEKTIKSHGAAVRRFEAKLNDLEHERKNLNQSIAELKDENNGLKTTVIQRENVILALETRHKLLDRKYVEQHEEYERLSRRYEGIKEEHHELSSQCTNYKMDIDIFRNRLEHFERDEANENRSDVEDKVESLRAMLSDLEQQNKHCLVTIDDLSKEQAEYVQLQQKYEELKTTNDAVEGKLSDLEAKHNDLHCLYQSKMEELGKMSGRCEQIEAENSNLRQNLNERDVELEALQKQHSGLSDSYSDLQHQYLQNTKSRRNESERRTLLQNDAERLLLENEEWISKYNDLKATFDALNDDYIHCKNQSAQIEGLLAETKQFEQNEKDRLQREHQRKLQQLQRERKALDEKLKDAQNENIILKNRPTLSISEHAMLCNKEQELMDIANKMYIADQASEPSFKCTICSQLFVDPITCQPCGHSFCSKCIKKRRDICAECKVHRKYFANEILESLSNGFKMRFKTYLPALRQMAGRKTNVSGVAAATAS